MNKNDSTFGHIAAYDPDVKEVGAAELELFESLKAFTQADFTTKEPSLPQQQKHSPQIKEASITDIPLPELCFNEHVLRGVREGLDNYGDILDKCSADIFEAHLGD